jgi:hypothetical protein
MISHRFLFPAIYPFFLVPTFSSPVYVKLAIVIGGPCLALAFNFRAIRRLGMLLLVALVTLLPMLLLVQTAVCTSPSVPLFDSLASCIVQRSVAVLLNVCGLSSVFLVAAANEWRGSLVATINGMCLPRQVRVMAIVSAAMIGGFRRSMLRVHHAYTARGEAMPAIHLKNLLVLPTMLGTVWAAELNGLVLRVKGQWSSDTFWTRYVPANSVAETTLTFSDVTLVVAGVLLLGGWALSFRF